MQYIENYLTSLKDKLKTGCNKREYDMLVKARTFVQSRC